MTPQGNNAAESEFRPLPLSAWRGYRLDTLPEGWHEDAGVLTRTARGRDIITRELFTHFELRLDWKVEPGGNSGIMYRVTEEYPETYWSGPEYQVLDDSAHNDGRDRLTAAGSLYAIYASPPGAVHRAGEWNAARIVLLGTHVEHWLNGTKVVDYELGSPDYERRVAASKFRAWPNFGRARSGHLALQDHGDRVSYRNIRIRELNEPR